MAMLAAAALEAKDWMMMAVVAAVDCEVERERKPSLTCKLKLTFLNCKHRKNNSAVKPMSKNTKNAKTFTSFNETLKGFNVGKAKLSLCCFIMGRREKKKTNLPFFNANLRGIN